MALLCACGSEVAQRQSASTTVRAGPTDTGGPVQQGGPTRVAPSFDAGIVEPDVPPLASLEVTSPFFIAAELPRDPEWFQFDGRAFVALGKTTAEILPDRLAPVPFTILNGLDLRDRWLVYVGGRFPENAWAVLKQYGCVGQEHALFRWVASRWVKVHDYDNAFYYGGICSWGDRVVRLFTQSDEPLAFETMGGHTGDPVPRFAEGNGPAKCRPRSHQPKCVSGPKGDLIAASTMCGGLMPTVERWRPGEVTSVLEMISNDSRGRVPTFQDFSADTAGTVWVLGITPPERAFLARGDRTSLREIPVPADLDPGSTIAAAPNGAVWFEPGLHDRDQMDRPVRLYSRDSAGKWHGHDVPASHDNGGHWVLQRPMLYGVLGEPWVVAPYVAKGHAGGTRFLLMRTRPVDSRWIVTRFAPVVVRRDVNICGG